MYLRKIGFLNFLLSTIKLVSVHAKMILYEEVLG